MPAVLTENVKSKETPICRWPFGSNIRNKFAASGYEC
jgi:hypothetical protein